MTDDDEAAAIERGDAQPWLDRLEEAEKAFAEWQSAADNIDKQYADMSRLRNGMRDREFALFWSNIQVMGPSIYARPPVPVVTPRFKDRRPLYRTASEFLERCCVVAFDMADIDDAMLALRDDLSIVGRGAGWLRYESDDDGERVCVDSLDRKDFRHEAARRWRDVDWVANRAWLTKKEMRERFKSAADEVNYETRRDKSENGSVSKVEKCGVWEIWCKSQNKVVWVTEGTQKVLEESEPHLKLDGFWPCPKPVYATVQRRSLIPVPDMLQYKDQLEEVNSLTRRIHTLSEAIRLRGFYSGGGDVGDAIERAMRMADDEQVLIPIPNLASLSATSGDPIVWLPLDMVANTITGLIELRRQVIDDVYQIVGLSDIMRGATDPNETAKAQSMKQQNGSMRVRDKQQELVRWARDAVRIAAEIMAEEFDRDTLEDMAQMDLPTDADVEEQIDGIEKQAEAAAQQAREQLAQAQQQGQQVDPEQAQQQLQQQIQQFQQQLDEAAKQVTIDQVMEFLQDEKLRPYVLDIETDSTVYPDEVAEKQSRAEFMQAFSASMSALQPMMAMGPEAISVAGAVFKFALAPYRVGRELEGLIDDFVDQGPQIAKRMQEQSGEDDGLAAAQMKLAEAEVQKAQAAIAKVQADTQKAQMEMQLKSSEAQAKAQSDQQRIGLEFEQTRGSIAEIAARVKLIEAERAKISVDASNQTRKEDREDVKAAADIAMRQADQAMAAQQQDRAAFESDRDAAMGDRQQSFNEQQGVRSEDRADRQQNFAERDQPE